MEVPCLGLFSVKEMIEYLITSSHLKEGRHNTANHLFCACVSLNVYFTLKCFGGISLGSEVWMLCGHHLQESKNLPVSFPLDSDDNKFCHFMPMLHEQ